MLSDHIHAWSGSAYRHIPADSPYSVLDTRFAGRVAENRWNVPGEPTLYLAGDVGVALAEYARHFQESRTAALALVRQRRALYRLEIGVERVFDVRQPAVRRELSLHGGLRRFLDLNLARATSQFVRASTSAEALLVPSIAFLDDPSRWNLVLFLEKLPNDLPSFIAVHPEGMLEVGGLSR